MSSPTAGSDGRRLVFLAGVLAAGVGLAAAELMAGLSSQVPSLVVAVGDVFVDGAPGDVVDVAIRSVGSADKPLLLAAIVVVTMLVGGRLATASLDRWWVGPVGIAIWTLLAAWAGARDPLTAAGGPVATAVIAGIASLGAFLVLVRLAARASGQPWPPGWPEPTSRVDAANQAAPTTAGAGDRRAFFRVAGLTAAGAAVAGFGGRRLGHRFNVEAARAELTLPDVSASSSSGTGLDVPGLSPFITPNDDFYRIDTALIVPQVSPDDFLLTIGGMVDQRLELTYDDLLARPHISETVTIACVSNEVGDQLVGNAVWQGVLLSDLLEEAGVQAGAEQVVGRSVDRFTAGFPIEAATDGRPTMVAVGMNGEPLPVRHGFPARLIVPGLYGYVSATKWLSDISLTTWDGFDGYWVPLGWSKEGPIKTQSRIDVPRNPVDAGTVAIAGVAWAPTRGISKVEVQVDDGEWREAELGPGTTDLTWRQWAYRTELDDGTYQVRVRATDGEGDTQTEDSAPPRPDGATGWHTKSVTVA